jgi:heat shock protein beta
MRSLLILLLFGAIADPSVDGLAPSAGVETTVDGFDADQRSEMESSAEKHEFQAEVNRLMDIIINSLYTDKTVFLRELISNAADALEKVRFLSVQDETYLGETKDLEVKIEFDNEAKTLSIIDTGVGMTKADLINNLGTVAKSGTTNFLEAMSEGGDANLIGQFGVGFYSAFLVADKISVTSKNNDDDTQHVWESSADASFSVVEDPRGNTLGRGSRITLYLKEDAHEFLSEEKLKELGTKFSQFISFPIYVKVKKEIEAEAEEEEDEEDDDEDVEVKDDDDDKKDSEKPKTKQVVYEWEQINTQKAIWMRNKEDVTEEEYKEFYKSVSKDYLEPLAYTHFNAEGEIEFKSILYVPKKAPMDMMDNYWTKKAEIKLFVRRVLVADKFEELMPRYLNFVRGVVDSDDLPLNVSREQLQQNKIMKVISKKLVRKILELLKKLAKTAKPAEKGDDDEAEEEEGDKKEDKKDGESDYDVFFKEFGKNMKMGCYEDDANRSKLAKLLRFYSTKSEDKTIFLDQYLDRMPESQDSIYFMSGDSLDVMRKAPALQMFTKKDIEVLMFEDQLDEPCIQKLSDYEGKKFVSIQKADVKLEETEDEKKHFNRVTEYYKPLTEWMKESLSDLTEKGAMKDSGVKIDKVEVSKRLVEAPCVVVTSQFGYSAQQEKIMRAQAFQNKDQFQMMAGRKILEINPNHAVIQDLLEKVNVDKDDARAKATAEVLFQSALLESGYEISDPSALVKRVYEMMSKDLGVDPDAPLVELDLPEEEEEEEEEEKEDEEDVDAQNDSPADNEEEPDEEM